MNKQLKLYVKSCPCGHINRRVGYIAPIKQACDQCGATVEYGEALDSTAVKGIQSPFGTRISFDTSRVLETVWNVTYLKARHDEAKRGIAIYADSIIISDDDDYGYNNELYVSVYDGNTSPMNGGSHIFLRKVSTFPSGLTDDEVVAMFARQNIPVVPQVC